MRRAALVLAALAVLGSAACSHDSRPATWEPGAAGSPAPTVVTPQAEGGTGPRPAFTENPDGTLNRSGGPPPSTSESKLSAGGLGPYKIGASVESLQTAKLITGAKPAAGCANYTTAKGTSKYHSPQLIFFKGRLLYLTIGSDAVQTDKGIAIGSPLAKVKGSYPNGKVLNDWAGSSAWLTMTGDYALLFGIKNDKVAQVQAGMAEPIQFKYTDNQGC